jgi:ubiquinone/menaquinone biosynthesis C-methylase UbiE
LSRWEQYLRNDDDRRRWQNPESILKKIGVKKGYTFIDLGCGGGFFSIPAAIMVGEEGRVYALDADPKAINVTREKAVAKGLLNLECRVGRAEEEVLCNNCADVIFFGSVLHDFEDPLKVLTNSRKMLKPAGWLIDLDWKAMPMEIGPPQEIRFSEQKASKLISTAGFSIDNTRESGPYHYIISARIKLPRSNLVN